ncbi:MAG: hypothetical protein F6K17_32725 [Okeania sp. SIO3C4]|nr:hypothetical protein [Okeania sp. SIO3C4]
MNKETNPIREKILKGLELTSKRLIETKRDRNLELVISENRKVKKIKHPNFALRLDTTLLRKVI